MTKRGRVLYFVLLSSVAGALLLIVFGLSPGQAQSISPSDKMLPGMAFIASCFLCFSLTVSPNWPGRLISRSPRSRAKANLHAGSVEFRGHHPDCVGFQSHRITLGKGEFCSGCLGLASGAAVSIPLMMIYMAYDWSLSRGAFAAFMAAGFSAVSIAYLEAAFGRRRAVLHVIANSFMIVGFFLLVVGMMGATGNDVSGLLAVSFSFLWIDTRIQLSNWRHSIVCDECPKSCKMY